MFYGANFGLDRSNKSCRSKFLDPEDDTSTNLLLLNYTTSHWLKTKTCIWFQCIVWSIIAGVRCWWANKYRHNGFWLFSDRWQAHGDQKPPGGQQSKMVIYCQKQLPPKTATNGHLTAIFSKQSVRCFKTAWPQLRIRPKIVFQFKKLTNWWHFAWISCSFLSILSQTLTLKNMPISNAFGYIWLI